MRVNVDKVLERDQKLSELDDRADALQAGASQFESSAAKLKRKYWWKNCKVSVPALRAAPFLTRGKQDPLASPLLYPEIWTTPWHALPVLATRIG